MFVYGKYSMQMNLKWTHVNKSMQKKLHGKMEPKTNRQQKTSVANTEKLVYPVYAIQVFRTR